MKCFFIPGLCLIFLGLSGCDSQRKTMSTSTSINKQAYLHILDAISQNEPDTLDRYMSDNIIDHNPMPDQAAGLGGFKQWMHMARTAFPDLHATVEDVLTDGDKVVGRITWHGTQQGKFAGIEPTGKPVSFTTMHIVRFEDGKAVEWWGVADLFGAIQQLQ